MGERRSVSLLRMEERNDIVIYQSQDGLVKMEALVDPSGETIGASQKAIAAMFHYQSTDISSQALLAFYMGINTEERQRFIMKNLRDKSEIEGIDDYEIESVTESQ